MPDQKILVKFPTRQRPDKFLKVLDEYIQTSVVPYKIFYVIIADKDDDTMNNKTVQNRIAARENVLIVYGDSKTKIEAVNAYIPPLDFQWDILLLASDDMIPIVDGWDNVIGEKMDEYYPDGDGVLWFNDGYQGKKLNTLPIMGRKYYERFGFIYNPVYITWWCDNEFMEIANILGKQTYFDQVIIEHQHPDNINTDYDELYIKNNNHHGDKAVFVARKENYFFLKKLKLLIVQPGRNGDILICLPIAKHFSKDFEVHWMCPSEYWDIFRDIDYCKPIKEIKDYYDVNIDLSFGFGGQIEGWWQINKRLFDSFVSAKYHLAGVPLVERWYLEWNRNIEKENELYDRIVAKVGDDYILTHEETWCGRFIQVENDCKVEFKPIDGFNIFDWYKVILNAREIHCIDSALSNFIESVKEFESLEKTIYLSIRESKYYLRSIYKNGWHKV